MDHFNEVTLQWLDPPNSPKFSVWGHMWLPPQSGPNSVKRKKEKLFWILKNNILETQFTPVTREWESSSIADTRYPLWADYDTRVRQHAEMKPENHPIVTGDELSWWVGNLCTKCEWNQPRQVSNLDARQVDESLALRGLPDLPTCRAKKIYSLSKNKSVTIFFLKKKK